MEQYDKNSPFQHQIAPEWTHYLDEVDLMLGAEGLHQLDVHGLVAVGGKDAEMCLTPATGREQN